MIQKNLFIHMKSYIIGICSLPEKLKKLLYLRNIHILLKSNILNFESPLADNQNLCSPCIKSRALIKASFVGATPLK